MDIAVCCDGSKNLEWSVLIINCMLIIFLTAVKAIQLYLIGTSSRFLKFFSRRIYSCKKQNNAKKSQTAHAGMATSPTAAAQRLGHWDTKQMLFLAKLHNEFCFCLMQSPNGYNGFPLGTMPCSSSNLIHMTCTNVVEDFSCQFGNTHADILFIVLVLLFARERWDAERQCIEIIPFLKWATSKLNWDKYIYFTMKYAVLYLEIVFFLIKSKSCPGSYISEQ